MISLALTILQDAAERSKHEAVDGPAVRLALRVLVPHARLHHLILLGQAIERAPNSGVDHYLSWVVQSVRADGWLAPSLHQVDRAKDQATDHEG